MSFHIKNMIANEINFDEKKIYNQNNSKLYFKYWTLEKYKNNEHPTYSLLSNVAKLHGFLIKTVEPLKNKNDKPRKNNLCW